MAVITAPISRQIAPFRSKANSPFSFDKPYPSDDSSENYFQLLTEKDLEIINSFNATNAFSYIQQQISFGPRIPGTNGSISCQNWIISQLESHCNVTRFPFTIVRDEIPWNGTNIVAKMNQGHEKIVIFAAHYDSRAVAEKDPNEQLRTQPIDGVNDGGSGVAVLLEMAMVLGNYFNETQTEWNYEFWFVFFDAEDQGYNQGYYGLQNFDWCEGSKYMVNEMQNHPEKYFWGNQTVQSIKSFVLLDMVGGENLEFIKESHASQDLQDHIFKIANHIGYEGNFPSDAKTYSIIDDHVPFAELGVPTADLIIKFWDPDNGWPYHHTHGDNLTHISQESLELTGKTLLYFVFFTFHPSLEKLPPSFSAPSYFEQNWQSMVILGIGILAVVIYGITTLLPKNRNRFPLSHKKEKKLST